MLMRKAVARKGDFYKGLLDWRNTPTAETMLSPVQRLCGRRNRTTLPTREELFEPIIPVGVKEKKVNAREKAASYYDKGSKELKELVQGDSFELSCLVRRLGQKGLS